MPRTHSTVYLEELHHDLDTSRHRLQMITSRHCHQDHPLLAHRVIISLHHLDTTISLTVAAMDMCSTKGMLHTAAALVRTTVSLPQRIRNSNSSNRVVAQGLQGVAGVEVTWEHQTTIVIAMDHRTHGVTTVSEVRHRVLLAQIWATMLYVDEREIFSSRQFGEHAICTTVHLKLESIFTFCDGEMEFVNDG